MNKFMDVDLDDIENKTCCGMFEALHQMGYRTTFEYPMAIDFPTRKAWVPGWIAHCHKETPAGNVSSKDAICIVLAYCPFCGADLKGVVIQQFPPEVARDRSEDLREQELVVYKSSVKEG